jgi:hypothetical protein
MSKKNIMLLRLNLDMSFFAKVLKKNLDVADASIFCTHFIDDIKQYYNFEDLVVIDSINTFNNRLHDPLRAKMLSTLINNLSAIRKKLQSDQVVLREITLEDERSYTMYIFPIENDTGTDGFIVCLESLPSLLDNHEITTLTNAISLLRSKLLH